MLVQQTLKLWSCCHHCIKAIYQFKNVSESNLPFLAARQRAKATFSLTLAEVGMTSICTAVSETFSSKYTVTHLSLIHI